MKRPWHEFVRIIETEIEQVIESLKAERDPIEVNRLQASIGALEWVLEQSDQPEPPKPTPPEAGYV